ncbi:HD-GYP domain, c-di-GMP phosphodiesterase class II (or its inactivated variant) [Marinitoga hydrogenitolerans DSM 16785]|uniref:HD-GYP domain, c-di-GMP phosphodiesterase class II (Or its inactivated variant) n=1 Tax=Marinitoga hydrogenitolerans (strain DSM 16785 / JCM 12826 / AT1271) TaxID=1122195 RepID=A0A1M4U4U4_MARH1|nr:HD domain-containing phosphohydrolase [Marinitoga hydrogenitolerans]SHE51557.1 HD-GYP domain, c-di-GMP phosphodiesterase class II (or its inactivated variant) [Marinitoga hydrogenitolerans DSM 16785]
MNNLYNLILENLSILKEMDVEYKISIDNESFDNIKKNKNEKIRVLYKGTHNVEISFFEKTDNIYLLSLDKIIKKFCSIKKFDDPNKKIFDFLSQIKPNINFEKTIENIKKTLKEVFNLDDVEFYFSTNKNLLFKNISFPIYSMKKFSDISCFFDKTHLPIFLEKEILGYFILTKHNGFDLYDYALLYELNDYINKNIENSFLENKFNIILDKSLNILTKILETRVPGAEKHCQNISRSAVKIGEYLNLNKKDIKNLKFGSMIFDIGKIGIPEYVLLKKEDLTLEENELIKKHVNYGYNLVSKITTISEDIKKIVLYHHEKWNGEGYPEGLYGDNIPLLAQIIGLLDTYYSLLEDRPYRNKLPKRKALELMESYSGIFFNPILVKALKEVINND